jgi:polyphenol oxidase
MSTRLQFEWLKPNWPAPANVRAASTLRTGGVSAPPYDSLNLGAHVGDASEAVKTNRARLREALRLPGEPCWLDQVHGTSVVEADMYAEPSKADAGIARSANQVCVVMTADCLPVLFCNREGDRVAAAHAGWRGLAGGVLESTVSALGLPGGELMAWLGPAIGQDAFEVGDEVRIAFMSQDAGNAAAFKPSQRVGHWYADLYQLARRHLQRLGIANVYGGNWCTFTDEARFFSYRRDGQCGRMASLIWIEQPS